MSKETNTLFDKNLADLTAALRKFNETLRRYESESTVSVIEPQMLGRLAKIIHQLEAAAEAKNKDDEQVLAPLLLLTEVIDSIGEISRWSADADPEGGITKVLKALKNLENRGGDFLSSISSLHKESVLAPTLQKLTGLIQEKRHLIAKRLEEAKEEHQAQEHED